MKLRHFFMIFVSLLLPSCTNNKNNETDNLNNEIIEEPLSLETPSTPNNTRYLVSDVENNTSQSENTNILLENTSKNNENTSNNLLASFSTKVYTKTAERIGNLNIVCSKVDGHIVHPGEEFSYNTIAGPYNKENGFGKATVFVAGEEVQEYGGGVCQLSSTLYNAIKNLDVEITERHEHSKEVYYVPKGQDATVSYDSGLDFKFKNTGNYPIMIKASSNKNNVTVSIYQV